VEVKPRKRRAQEDQAEKHVPEPPKRRARVAQVTDSEEDDHAEEEEEQHEQEDDDDDDDDDNNPYFDDEAQEADEDYQESGTDGEQEFQEELAAAELSREREEADRRAKRAARVAHVDTLLEIELKKDKQRALAARREDKELQEKARRARMKREKDRRLCLRRGANWAAGNRTLVSSQLTLRRPPGDKLINMLAPQGSTPEARETALQSILYWAATQVLAPVSEQAQEVVSLPKRKKKETDEHYAQRVAKRKETERTKRMSGSFIKAGVIRALRAINPCLQHGLYKDLRSSWVVELDSERRKTEERREPTVKRNAEFNAATALVKELRIRKELDTFHALSREKQEKLRDDLLHAELTHAQLALKREKAKLKQATNTLNKALQEKESFPSDLEKLSASIRMAELYTDAIKLHDVSSIMSENMKEVAVARAKKPADKEKAAAAVDNKVNLINACQPGDLKAARESLRKAEKKLAADPNSQSAKNDVKAMQKAWGHVHRRQEEWKRILSAAQARVAKLEHKLKAKKDSYEPLKTRIERNKKIAAAATASIREHMATIKNHTALVYEEEEDDAAAAENHGQGEGHEMDISDADNE
jgi:hypothetical protein